jgi:hypothetical protein
MKAIRSLYQLRRTTFVYSSMFSQLSVRQFNKKMNFEKPPNDEERTALYEYLKDNSVAKHPPTLQESKELVKA